MSHNNGIQPTTFGMIIITVLFFAYSTFARAEDRIPVPASSEKARKPGAISAHPKKAQKKFPRQHK